MCFIGTVGLTSCHKSNKALIEEANKNFKEGLKAMKKGDHEKSMEHLNKANSLIKEIGERDLTDEEKEQLGKVIGSSQTMRDVMEEE